MDAVSSGGIWAGTSARPDVLLPISIPATHGSERIMETLEKIARNLADAGEPMDDSFSYCILCDPPEGDQHSQDCPWVLATVWVAEHKEPV